MKYMTNINNIEKQTNIKLHEFRMWKRARNFGKGNYLINIYSLFKLKTNFERYIFGV